MALAKHLNIPASLLGVLILEDHDGGVVHADDEVGPAVFVDVGGDEAFGVAGDDESAGGGRYGGEVAVFVALEEDGHAAVEPAHFAARGVGVLHDVGVGKAVAVEVAESTCRSRRKFGP